MQHQGLPNRIGVAYQDISYSAIGGGRGNTIDYAGFEAVIGGGGSNTVLAPHASILGGRLNVNEGDASTICGGQGNHITGSAMYGTVGGGFGNQAGGPYSTIGGGDGNSASGTSSTIPGGRSNIATGEGSYAAGSEAMALHDGSFVWSDNASGNQVASSGVNQWTARAGGGVRFFTNSLLTSGVQLAAGGSSWSSLSDRDQKENFEKVDTKSVLEGVVGIPMLSWNYKSEGVGVRHMGPMAQDFWPAFGLGEDPLRIHTIDADGVAFAAIQGLHGLLVEERVKVVDLESRVSELERVLADLLPLLAGTGQAEVASTSCSWETLSGDRGDQEQ